MPGPDEAQSPIPDPRQTALPLVRGWWHDIAESRAPDFVIGAPDAPYLRRWWLVPRNPVQNIYLHHFMRSDDDRALHSHPWSWNISVLLEGQYLEHLPGGQSVVRRAGEVVHRTGESWHRIELTHGSVWTLFLTGAHAREWGFACPQGFVHWRDFTAPGNPGAIGRGCG